MGAQVTLSTEGYEISRCFVPALTHWNYVVNTEIATCLTIPILVIVTFEDLTTEFEPLTPS